MGDLCMLNGLEVKKYKNYKELCKALGWKVKTGNAKKAQLRQLSSVCKWRKDGNAIIITEIYAEPKKQQSTTSKYKEVTSILKSILKSNKQYIYTFSTLCRITGLVNYNNFTVIDKTKNISNYLNINLQTAEDFLNDTKTRLRSITETALNNLQKQGYINWCYTYNLQTVDSNNNLVWNIATELEEVEIKQTIADTVTEMGYNSVQEVYLKKRYKQLCNIVTNKLNNNNICISCYRCYLITVFNNNNSNNNKVGTLRKKVNKLFVNSCIKSLSSRIDNVNNNNNNIWGRADKSYIRNRQSKNYKKDTKKLINIFIKLDFENIVNKII